MLRNRIDLAEYFDGKLFRVGAEIGVADGRYSEILCQKIPGLQLYAVDPYIPYDGNWRSAEYQEKALQKAFERLKPYPKAKIIRATSLEASRDLPERCLDFVFIDGAHDFDNTMLDIILWTQKVRKGGIVALHDMYHFKTGGVFEAVTTYTKSHEIELNIIPRYSGGHKDDQAPCAWWIKK